jgi:N-methylhydantoinase A
MTVIGVDVGGTFTDIILVDAKTGKQFVHKVATTPHSQDLAVTRGIDEIVKRNNLRFGDVTLVVHGTTVATNAMLERKGARVVLLTTQGLEDVIEIGRQNRDEIYSLVASRPEPLVTREDRVGVKERLDFQGEVIQPLQDGEIERVVELVQKRRPEAVAVSLLFSYANPSHERLLVSAISDRSSPYVVSSSQVLPEFREFERTSTTVLEAYLGPLVVRYLKELDDSLSMLCPRSRLAVMQSNGGTILAREAEGHAIGLAISGLAGGAIGGWEIAKQEGLKRAITLDMGGTSCDISAITGRVLVRADNDVAGLPLRTPSVDVKTIGAGGGSIAWLDGAAVLHVGPQSAGAVPGPASYANGGTDATVTDANVVVGRLNPDNFLGGDIPLDRDLAHQSVRRLANRMGMNTRETALGIIRISTANMVAAIREVTIERGEDPRDFVLVAFGGAGPTQAVDIAEALGIERILIPPHPGITSALGLVCTDLRVDLMQSILKTANEGNLSLVQRTLEQLAEDAAERLERQGASRESISVSWSMDMRYSGQSHELNTPLEGSETGILLDSIGRFEEIHSSTYGYELEDRPIEWVTARTTATSSSVVYRPYSIDVEKKGEPVEQRELVLGDGLVLPVDVFRRHSLAAGQKLKGPCIIEQLDTTVYVGPEWRAEQRRNGSLVMRRSKR